MTPQEAAMLLAVAAAFDNRKPDPDAATAWAAVFDGLRFEDCRDAIVGYYRTHREWIMPSDIVAGVQEIRNRRLSEFWRITRQKYLTPPARFADDPSGEHQWISESIRRICNGDVTTPEQLEDDRGELQPHDVSSLGLIGRSVPRE